MSRSLYWKKCWCMCGCVLLHPASHSVPCCELYNLQGQMGVSGVRTWCDYVVVSTCEKFVCIRRVHYCHKFWLALKSALLRFLLAFKWVLCAVTTVISYGPACFTLQPGWHAQTHALGTHFIFSHGLIPNHLLPTSGTLPSLLCSPPPFPMLCRYGIDEEGLAKVSLADWQLPEEDIHVEDRCSYDQRHRTFTGDRKVPLTWTILAGELASTEKPLKATGTET